MKKEKTILIILLIMGIGLISVFGFSYAKYVSNSIVDYYLKSKGFYFSSDYLGSNNVQNVNNLWEGDSVHFNIKNNLNDIVITDYDIDYTVTCEVSGEEATYTTCGLNGTQDITQTGTLSSFQTCVNNTEDQVDVSSFNKTTCELNGYTWENQIANKDLYFDVILTDENYSITDLTVNITVSSTNPYQKTLSGAFVLHKKISEEDKLTMTYNNYDNYDRLVVANSYSVNKCIKITWDSSKLLIDANYNDFSAYEVDIDNYLKAITFNIDSKSSVNYVFYKRYFNEIYDVGDFVLQESTGC